MQSHRVMTRIAIAAILAMSGPFRVDAQAVEVAFPPTVSAVPVPVVPEMVDPGLRDLRIIVDFAAILYIEGGMSAVAVGNPAIANANLINHRTVIVSGHLAGTTNVVVLDETGRILADVTVYVTARKPGTVRERRGTEVEILNCTNGLCDGEPNEALSDTAPLVVGAGS